MRSVPLAILVLAVGLAAPAASCQTGLSAEDWRDDLAFLTRELVARHADAFHTVGRETFEAAAARLHERIPGLDHHEVIVGMSELVALIGDGHTRLELPSSGPLAFARYPVQLTRLQDGVFVARADAAHADLVGARLVAIDGVPVEEVWSRVEPVVSRDNAMTVRLLVPWRIVRPEVLHAVGVLPEVGPAAFTVEADGATETVRLGPQDSVGLALESPGEADSPAGLYWRDPGPNYWVERVPEHRAVYLQFNAVRDDPDDPFAAFIDRLEGALGDPAVDRLVIDLRRNAGGGWRLTVPLIKVLIRHGYDEPGRLAVLTGPLTFSAAVVFAVELENWLDPLFVGLPSGGRPNQWGEIVHFTLPNSGVLVGYAAAYFQTAGYESVDPWILPDVAVDATSEDHFARRDPVLLAALTFQPQRGLGERLDEAYEAGGVEAALAVFERYRSDPRNAYRDAERPFRSFGERLVEEGWVDDALRVHRRNVEVHPDRTRAHWGLAGSLEALGRDEEARRAYEAAYERLAADPSLYPALRVLAGVRLRERLAE